MKFSKSIVFIFSLLFVYLAHSEIFVCVEHGKRKLKNDEICNGKITNVYKSNGEIQSYKQFKSDLVKQNQVQEKTVESTQFSSLKTKQDSAGSDDLTVLLARCSSEFDSLRRTGNSETWGQSADNNKKLKILVDKCNVNTAACYKKFDVLYHFNFEGASAAQLDDLNKNIKVVEAECSN
jgi:hypothetical protein